MEIWVIDGMIEYCGAIDLLDGCVCKNLEDAKKSFELICSQCKNEFVEFTVEENEDKNDDGELLSVRSTIKSYNSHDIAIVRMSKFILPAEFFKSK